MKQILKLSFYLLPLAFISLAPSCEDICKKCKADPTIPGCKEVLESGKCTVPPTTTTTTTSTSTTSTTSTSTTSTTTTTTTLPPNPNPSTCRAPQGVEWIGGTKLERNFDKAVNQAIVDITGCDVGSDCHTGMQEEAFLLLVSEKLRVKGFCAGQHEENISDEIAVACTILSEDGLTCLLSSCDNVHGWEGKHIAHFGGDKIVWCPGADRPSWIPVSCPVRPSPTPSPSPNNLCSNPTPGPLTKWEVKIHNVGPNWITLTSTPLVGPDAVFCKAIGYTDGRRYCPPRAEGTDPSIIKACNDMIVGEPPLPNWYWNNTLVGPDGLNGEVVHPSGANENPYNLLVRPNLHGTATVCNRDSVCGALTF